MNVSYPFIMRPVGTTLLAIGLLLIGIVAYRFLPGRQHAERRAADHPRVGEPAGRRPGHHGGDGRGAARAQSRHASRA